MQFFFLSLENRNFFRNIFVHTNANIYSSACVVWKCGRTLESEAYIKYVYGPIWLCFDIFIGLDWIVRRVTLFTVLREPMFFNIFGIFHSHGCCVVASNGTQNSYNVDNICCVNWRWMNGISFSDGLFQNGKPFYIRNLIEHCHRLYNNGHIHAVTKPIKCMYSTRFVIGSDWNTTNSFQLIFSAINETIFKPLHSVLPFSSRRLSKGLTRISISWKNLSHEAYSNVSIKF